MKEINIYIKTNINCPSKKSGRGMYYLETYQNGEPVTRCDTIELADTTMQRAHVQTLLAALERVRVPCEINVITEFEFVINLLGAEYGTGWLYEWQRNGFKNNKGLLVKNVELMQRLWNMINEKGHRIRAQNSHNSYGLLMDEELKK